MLNALLESKYDRNAPSVVLAQANSLELSIPGRDIDGSTPAYVPDAERVVEHAIARRSKRILELALECVQVSTECQVSLRLCLTFYGSRLPYRRTAVTYSSS